MHMVELFNRILYTMMIFSLVICFSEVDRGTESIVLRQFYCI
jgi:hypothetical protein